MAEFEVAHFREQGQDMIVIPLKRSFGNKPQSEQDEVHASLQACATSAGLRGRAVLVWDSGGGRMAFRAPKQWHPFFRSLDLRTVAANINRKLTCD